MQGDYSIITKYSHPLILYWSYYSLHLKESREFWRPRKSMWTVCMLLVSLITYGDLTHHDYVNQEDQSAIGSKLPVPHDAASPTPQVHVTHSGNKPGDVGHGKVHSSCLVINSGHCAILYLSSSNYSFVHPYRFISSRAVFSVWHTHYSEVSSLWSCSSLWALLKKGKEVLGVQGRTRSDSKPTCIQHTCLSFMQTPVQALVQL